MVTREKQFLEVKERHFSL